MLRFTELLATLVIVVTAAGCQGVMVESRIGEPVAVRTPGPPPHAPAHGYRRKHQTGPELRFDSRLGVYVVEGRADVYFSDGWFIRIRNGIWQFSARLGGKWEVRSANWVPPGLRSKYHAKNSKSQGLGAAKFE